MATVCAEVVLVGAAIGGSPHCIIALADDETDAYGNWAPVAGDPGRHFDTAHGGVDSRVLYANTELEKAISQYNKGNRCEAYKSLGRGLHSTQDIIAHMGWVPLLAHPSWYDDASFRISELEATEIATKLYLFRFLSATRR